MRVFRKTAAAHLLTRCVVRSDCSRNHHTPEQFRAVYHRENLEAVKARLDPAGTFPDFFKTFHQV